MRSCWRFSRGLHFLKVEVTRQIRTWNCARHGSVVCVIRPNPETGEMERLLHSRNLFTGSVRTGPLTRKMLLL
jgi:hypothetical protein